MVYDPFTVVLNLVCLYFVEGFCVYVHQRFSFFLSFFFGDIFVWFWYQDDSGFIE